jgi:hypothetical protein
LKVNERTCVLFKPIFQLNATYKSNIENNVMLDRYLTLFCESFILVRILDVKMYDFGPETGRKPAKNYMYLKAC